MCARYCIRAPHLSEKEKQSCCSMSERLSKIRGQNNPPKPQTISNNAMARKSSLLKQSLILSAFFIIAIYVFFSTFLNPTTTPPSSFFSDDHRISASSFFQSSSNAGGAAAANPKPKVFMYDLPKKFTTGIIQQHALARGSADVSKSTYPGHQHMGEFYLYSDLNRPEQDRIGSPVVKVSDPEEADLFHVPVFSSLSLIVKTNRPGSSGSSEYSDEEMQDELVEWLEKQEYWRRNGGRDHVIFAGDPNALYRVMDRVKNAVLLLSDFGRVRRDQGSLVKDIIVPYSHRINVYNGDVGVYKRTTLLFFMGNRYRKDGGKIRDLLFQTLENEEDVVIKHGTQSRENRRAATHGMHTSKFCLNPAGDTPSACRLFDAIVSLCVPVIVSDSIELPFEDVIDYRKIAVFVETTIALRPGYLVKKLRKISDERIVEYQQELRKVQRFFSYGNPNGTVNEIWREVTQKLPLIRLMSNRDKRLVKTEFSEPDCSCLCTNQTGIIRSIR